MKAWFNRLNRPIRIKSLKELEPGFTPRYFRYSFRLVLIGMVMMLFLISAVFLKSNWFFWMAISGFISVAVAFFLLNFVPPTLRIVGYYWPWLYLKSIQLDSWLEHDLDWEN